MSVESCLTLNVRRSSWRLGAVVECGPAAMRTAVVAGGRWEGSQSCPLPNALSVIPKTADLRSGIVGG